MSFLSAKIFSLKFYTKWFRLDEFEKNTSRESAKNNRFEIYPLAKKRMLILGGDRRLYSLGYKMIS